MECPMISGYSTARFYAPVLATAIDPPNNLLGVTATIVNQMNAKVILSFVPLADRSTPVLAASGVRCPMYDTGGSSIGNFLHLSGGGEAVVQFRTTQPVLEVFADGGGPAQVRITIDSLIQWDQQGFSRLDTKYPPALYQPKWSSFPWPTG